jgi:hypothetical protein
VTRAPYESSRSAIDAHSSIDASSIARAVEQAGQSIDREGLAGNVGVELNDDAVVARAIEPGLDAVVAAAALVDPDGAEHA